MKKNSGNIVVMSDVISRRDQQARATYDWEEVVNPCLICSSEEKEVVHKHFSSRWLRGLNGTEATNSAQYCPSCKSRHVPYPYTRSKLLVSDATLHMFFSPPGQTEAQYSGDLIHVDYISIPGASINDLTRAFKLEFVDNPQVVPLDVVIIAGYRELLEGQSRTDIMESFRIFAETVLKAGDSDNPNTIAISDLLYPPILTWYPDNGPIPLNHQGNRLLRLEMLNEEILSLNMDNNVTEFLRLHKYGIRVCTKRWIDQYGQEHQRLIKCHRLEQWREQNVAEKLHLTDAVRFKVGGALNKYFQLRTNWEIV